MVKEFIIEFVRLIVDYPDKIKIESEQINDGLSEITLYVHPNDVGRVIGKEGKMISSIKTLISGCKPKGGTNYKVNVKPFRDE